MPLLSGQNFYCIWFFGSKQFFLPSKVKKISFLSFWCQYAMVWKKVFAVLLIVAKYFIAEYLKNVPWPTLGFFDKAAFIFCETVGLMFLMKYCIGLQKSPFAGRASLFGLWTKCVIFMCVTGLRGAPTWNQKKCPTSRIVKLQSTSSHIPNLNLKNKFVEINPVLSYMYL